MKPGIKLKTKCCYCGKSIVVLVPKGKRYSNEFTCNECVPADSASRDGINESEYTEI